MFKKKILLYNTDLRGGGAEKILVNIANELQKRGHEVIVGTFFKEGINREDLNPNIRQFWAFEKPFKGYSKLALLFSPKFLFKKLIPNENFDVIISFLEGFPSRIIAGAPETQKTISWIHLELYSDTITKEFRSLTETQKCYSSFDKIICVAESVKSCFQKCLPETQEELGVIYNPLEFQDIENKANISNPYPKDDILKIVTVGRLNPQKAYDRLLRIALKLKNDGFQFKLYILGMGPMETELKNFVAQNHLGNKVEFLGFQKNPYPYIKNADLFVCSSVKEGYSTVVTESVLLETPVITTDCSGMAEILDNGNTGIITENDGNALYKGLKTILSDENLRQNLKQKTIERAIFLKNRKTYDKIENLINSI